MRRIAVFAVGLVVLIPSSASALTPQSHLYVNGPTSGLKLKTPYSYTVKVVPAKSYNEAVVSVKLTNCSQIFRHTHLTAGRVWSRKFVITYEQNSGPLELDVGVTVLPPHSGYRTLGFKRLPVSLEPGQPTTLGSVPKCAKYFGS
jgi:hypothetical protein